MWMPDPVLTESCEAEGNDGSMLTKVYLGWKVIWIVLFYKKMSVVLLQDETLYLMLVG